MSWIAAAGRQAGGSARRRAAPERGGAGTAKPRRPKIDVDRLESPVVVLADDLEPFQSEWHAHRPHQLLYSASGTLRLEVGGRQWLLPPQKAAWIPAETQHRVGAEQPVLLRTVYLAPALVRELGVFQAGECVVFPVSPVVRELILYGMRWDGARTGGADLAARLFSVCTELCAELAEAPLLLWLPTGQTSEIQRAVSHTLEHLEEDLRQAEVARVAGLSERTLARRFPEETQMTWQRFLHSARLLRATELLSAPGARVTATAFAVGFDSLAAFTRAFERFTGESPKDYRKRMQSQREGIS